MRRILKMDTVLKKQLNPTKLVFGGTIDEEKTNTFEVIALNVERSFEDRSVYFEAYGKQSWLQAEDAITLGQTLIEHGTNALMANMINHQLIHCYRNLKQYHDEGRFTIVTLEVVDEHPANYGRGHRTYKVTPNWIKDKIPEYMENFSFETVIYWSPFEEEYNDQLKNWWYPVIKGYDRDAELKEFEVSMKKLEEHMEGMEGTIPTDAEEKSVNEGDADA